MIDPKFLESLRCPFDAERDVPLEMDEHRVLCSRCKVRFPTRDGIINFLTHDAILPEGCSSAEQLPCQKWGK